jgi:TRAP-type C4-dicarboxylate transport system permease small subunit
MPPAAPPAAGVDPDPEAGASAAVATPVDAQTVAAAAAPPPALFSDKRVRIEDHLGALAMALLALITFVNVVVRYLTNESFAWSEEISVSLMVILTLVAGSAAVVRDRHIRIEVLFDAGTLERRRRFALLSALATVAAFLILASLGTRLAWDDYQYEVTSPGIGVPQWWYTVWLPVLAVVVAFRAMQRLVRIWRRQW